MYIITFLIFLLAVRLIIFSRVYETMSTFDEAKIPFFVQVSCLELCEYLLDKWLTMIIGINKNHNYSLLWHQISFSKQKGVRILRLVKINIV